jgi:hypothetical protein
MESTFPIHQTPAITGARVSPLTQRAELSTQLVGKRRRWVDLGEAGCLHRGVRAFSLLTRRRHVDFGRVADEGCRRSR